MAVCPACQPGRDSIESPWSSNSASSLTLGRWRAGRTQGMARGAGPDPEPRSCEVVASTPNNLDTIAPSKPREPLSGPIYGCETVLALVAALLSDVICTAWVSDARPSIVGACPPCAWPVAGSTGPDTCPSWIRACSRDPGDCPSWLPACRACSTGA